ncbi:MAG TPA: hypothetical protein PKK65_01305 [bacterium]|nr:MAG: hypothetical protein BWX82_00321 [Parcubacteria group bacterium ADurb.Bin115]HNU81353.1 hypothetical protein [bacterium]
MKKHLNILAAVICIFFIIPAAGAQDIDPGFNPNFIISDEEMMDYDSLSLAQIQNFLQKKNSYLANYSTTSAHGTQKSAAEIIYDATNNNYDCSGITLSDSPTEAEKQLKCRKITTINPKFLLVLLQKESSLIEDPNPNQARLDWATGYGCPDNWTCNPYYKGFGKQINSASLQFLAYMKEPQNYNYKAGQTYTFSNPYGTISNKTITVIPANQATAALYNYTPHVFDGNYNIYKLYQRYFPSTPARYPDGSLLQVKGEAGVWLIQDGLKRPFLTKSALLSRYSLDKIIMVEASDLESYDKGNPISLPNYSIVKAPDNTLYLIVGDEKRQFENQTAFKSFGFNPEEIIAASTQDLSYYRNGAMLTANSVYPTGALLRDPQSGGVYYVQDGNKAPIIDKVLLSTKFKGKTVQKASAEELARYTKISPVLFDDGELLKSESSSTVYLIANGKKRPFLSGDDFERLGYKWSNIITVSPQLLYLYPLGEAITYKSAA